MTETIHRSAWTIHRDLWNKQTKSGVRSTALDIAQGGKPDARDRALELGLAAGLGVDRLTQRALAGVTAQQYVSAFLVNLEPLALMYKDICEYAQRTNTRRSAHTRSIEWDFKVGNDDIRINPEHFRRYRAMLEDLPNENEFGAFMGRFEPAVHALTRIDVKPEDTDDSLSSFPPAPDARPEIHEVYRLGLRLFALPDDERKRRYRHASELPLLFWRLTRNPAAYSDPVFIGMAPPPGRCAKLQPEDILDLPFWKFRWQIYELWTVVVSLSELEKFDFVPEFSSDGKSMLETGRPGLLAARAGQPAAYVYAQSSYANSKGKRVHPDLVVSTCPDIRALTANEVHLIVEAKQQKRTLRYEASRRANLESAHAAYTAATSNDGVLILNYDEIPRDLAVPVGAHLFGRFHPGRNYSGTALHMLMERYLGPLFPPAPETMPAPLQVIVLDYSGTMACFMPQARSLLVQVLANWGPAASVYATFDGEFFEVDPDDAFIVGGSSAYRMGGAEQAQTLVAGLRSLAAERRVERAVFITDIEGGHGARFRAELSSLQAPAWLKVLSVAEMYEVAAG